MLQTLFGLICSARDRGLGKNGIYFWRRGVEGRNRHQSPNLQGGSAGLALVKPGLTGLHQTRT